jgi:hypothetical protein
VEIRGRKLKKEKPSDPIASMWIMERHKIGKTIKACLHVVLQGKIMCPIININNLSRALQGR